MSNLPPCKSEIAPPDSCTINAPAATSHGFKLLDQKASIRPQDTYAIFKAAEPLRWTV
jgi:hypothetical protein